MFHSRRHYYAARMADKADAGKVCRITGHGSKAVFEEYADHVTEQNLQEMPDIGAGVFDNILKEFNK